MKVPVDAEDRVLVELAIGRVLRIMSRPFREGDVEDYERCRAIIFEHSPEYVDDSPCWARDRLKGAQGD